MDLYGLIHSKFILTQRGLKKMKKKYIKAKFGYCPRVLCEKQIVLPIGMSKDLCKTRVKVFCPKCKEVYVPRTYDKVIDIDGAYFGTSFSSIFFQTFPDLNPKEKPVKNIEINKKEKLDIIELKEKLNQEKINNNSFLEKMK